MLMEIKNLLMERESVSLYDLSIHFRVEESAMEMMMEFFLRKGVIKKVDTACSSGGCRGCAISACHPSKTIYYHLI